MTVPSRIPVDAEARLFGPGAVAAHAFLFSPLVGGMMAALNWSRAGDSARARKTALLAVGATVALVVVSILWGMYAPESMQGALSGGIGGASGAFALALRREQKLLFDAHTAAGGKKASFFPATLAGLALAAIFLALTFAPLLSTSARETRAGVAALHARHLDEAEAHLRTALEADRDDDGARLLLADVLARGGRIDEAHRLLMEVRDSSELADQARAMRAELEAAGAEP